MSLASRYYTQTWHNHVGNFCVMEGPLLRFSWTYDGNLCLVIVGVQNRQEGDVLMFCSVGLDIETYSMEQVTKESSKSVPTDGQILWEKEVHRYP